MVKRFSFLFIAAVLFLLPAFGCGCNEETEYPDEEKAEKVSGSAEYAPLFEVGDGKTAAYIFMDEFLSFTEYTAEQTGTTFATVVFVTTEQAVYSKKIKKDGKLYFYTDTSSSLAKAKHEAIFNGDTVSYKENGGDAVTRDIATYGEEYGITFKERLIEGFVVNDNTVISSAIEKVGEEYKVTLDIDGNLGGYYVRTQMKKIGGLSAYPVFKSVRIILTLSEDYFPVKTVLVAKYSAKKGFNASCEQNLTTVYKRSAGEIPEGNFGTL